MLYLFVSFLYDLHAHVHLYDLHAHVQLNDVHAHVQLYDGHAHVRFTTVPLKLCLIKNEKDEMFLILKFDYSQ